MLNCFSEPTSWLLLCLPHHFPTILGVLCSARGANSVAREGVAGGASVWAVRYEGLTRQQLRTPCFCFPTEHREADPTSYFSIARICSLTHDPLLLYRSFPGQRLIHPFTSVAYFTNGNRWNTQYFHPGRENLTTVNCFLSHSCVICTKTLMVPDSSL